MIIRRIAWLTLIVSIGQACAGDTGIGLMNWMIGDWVTDDGAIREQWRSVSDDTLEGKGITTSEDKVSTESMRIVRMEGEIFFIAKVAHNELPIGFRLMEESTPQRTVFANPAHDFPRQIVYQKDGADGMIVTVTDGGEKGFELRFRRHQ